MITIVLFLSFVSPEFVRGLDSKGLYYVQTRLTKGPLREFTVKFDLPDIPSKEWR